MKEVKRPWGGEKHFVRNSKCTVKLLEVNPNEELSLQKHNLRTEEWYFLTDGYVQLGKKRKKVKKGTLVKIPKRKAHRIFAKKEPVLILEISYGKFRQRDEIRLEDKYGRK